MKQCMPRGPIPALIMVIGEAPGAEEEQRGIPFVGASGYELHKMLKEAGFPLDSCFVTNVCRIRPPGNDITKFISDRKTSPDPTWSLYRGKWVAPCILEGVNQLEKEIALVQPDLILALGNTPLWALTGNTGIQKWRGSMLYRDSEGRRTKVLPTLHPAAVLRQWDQRNVVVHDLRRGINHLGKEWPQPRWNFTVEPSFEEASLQIGRLVAQAQEQELILSVDIETKGYNIACLGIAWTANDAICIPFTSLTKPGFHYFSLEEEAQIVYRLSNLLTHPNVKVIGQNFIFDTQYIYRHWHFIPNFHRDTMLAQHTCFPNLPKGLDYICSLHNEHYVYWKDDGKSLSDDGDERKHWTYNCEDCVRTYEADTSLQRTIDKMGLRGPHDFQMAVWRPVLNMMNRGIHIDREMQKAASVEVRQEEQRLLSFIHTVAGYPLNPKSPKQMADFFYRQLALPKQFGKQGAGLSCSTEALSKLVSKQPLIAPLVQAIEEYRSCGVFLSNYLCDKRDIDGRVRCSYNIGGTKTFRFSSSENVWGSGLNLQTISKGDA